MDADINPYGPFLRRVVNYVVKSTLPESAGGAPHRPDQQLALYMTENGSVYDGASSVMARQERGVPASRSVKNTTRGTSIRGQQLPSKFLCGLRVATKPEDPIWRFTPTNYIELVATNTIDILEKLFKVLDSSEVDAVLPGPSPATFANLMMTAKPASPKANTRDSTAQETQKMEPQPEATPVPVYTNPIMSDSIEDFLNGGDSPPSRLDSRRASDDTSATAIDHRARIPLPARKPNMNSSAIMRPSKIPQVPFEVARPPPAARLMSTGTGTSRPSTVPRPAVSHRPRKDITTTSAVPQRANNFGLILRLPIPPQMQSGSWEPKPTAFDSAIPDEAINCMVYVHKDTKKVFVRGEDGRVHRALTVDDVDREESEEGCRTEEEEGWEFVDEVAYF